MKKSSNFMVIGMLFMASIIAELYFLLEFRGTIAVIIGGGAIVLLTTYLFLDQIQEYFMAKSTMIENGVKDDTLLEELVKVEKACYIALQQIKEANKEDRDKLLETLEIQKEQLIEAEINTAKLTVKCQREDIKSVVSGLKESASNIAVSIEKIATKSNVPQIVDGVSQSVESLEAILRRIEELLEQESRN